ncbi:MAG: threonylcarbamoyl-AMP synthase [Nocardioides sp.]|nr:threonylcarbamoyl-AMP synthase [Nocardioides sp.]
MSTVSKRFPTVTEDEQAAAVDAAATALQAGQVVVVPTDTVYGIAADAFDRSAVQRLLDAKGRGREKPPPVLVSNVATLDALATRVPDWARTLGEALWPGALTLVLHQQPSLQWDLGDSRSTVALRVPDHALLRKVIDRVGPLAVSSANRTGRPAAVVADQAENMLGDEVEVLVDGGDSPVGEASTIIDATGEEPMLLRAGAIAIETIDELLAEHDTKVRRPGEGPVTLEKSEADPDSHDTEA